MFLLLYQHLICDSIAITGKFKQKNISTAHHFYVSRKLVGFEVLTAVGHNANTKS
jgi:hypothetical protein